MSRRAPGGGRKPKPTILHHLHNTYRNDRHGHRPTGEPIAPGDLSAEPPEWLSDGQKESWRYTVSHAPKGVLKPIDRGIMTVWVEAEDRHRRAMQLNVEFEKQAGGGMIGKTKDGRLVPSPYIKIISQAAKIMVMAANQLGFTPAVRPRLAGGANLPGGKQDPDGAGDQTDLERFLASNPSRNPPRPLN